MAQKSLDISWTMPVPPLAPTAWHTWSNHQDITNSEEIEGDREIETGLSLAPGTLSILRAAFTQRLDRRTGWEVNSDVDAVCDAAKLFRRGVGFRSPAQPAQTGERHDQYKIEFLSAEPKRQADDWVVIDANVAQHWPEQGKGLSDFTMTCDEADKSLAAVAKILAAWRKAGEPKSWRVIGGGVLGDLAGFAAGLVDAKLSFVPTTLLAMADACVGGKTGCNFAPYGKNQLGLFYFPALVEIWPGWLKTLPQRHRLGGGFECLKHAWLRDNQELAKNLVQVLPQTSTDQLAQLLPTVVQVKAEVIARDPAEGGERATLNLGHTLAHALEAVAHANTAPNQTDEMIQHGEAVGLGLAFSLLVSRQHSGLPVDDSKRMIEQLAKLGALMPTEMLAKRLGCDPAADATKKAIFAAMAQDKKNLSGDVRMVLLNQDRKPMAGADGKWTEVVPHDVIESCWRELLWALPTR